MLTREMEITSTFKYEMADLKRKDESVGQLQFQFRGNAPFQSGFSHDEEKPYIAALNSKVGGMAGLVASSVLVARTYALGLVAPMLGGVTLPQKSPEYDGKVMTVYSKEVDALLNALNEDNMVMTKLEIGRKTVTGYTLIEVGFDNAWCVCGPCTMCGGKSEKLTSCTRKAETERLVKIARENGTRPTFSFRFYLEDPEKEVINRRMTKQQLDEKFYDFYHTGGREQVRCACTCVRFWKCPCNFTIDKVHCCSVGCYVRDRKKVLKPEEGVGVKVKAPNQVIMTTKHAWTE